LEHDASESGPAGIGPPDLPPSQELLDQAENLIRQAAIARRRNEFGQSRRLIEEAERIAPNSVVVLEAIGDLHFEQGKWLLAQEAFKKATALEPQNAAIERKYGEAVLKSLIADDAFRRRPDDAMVGGKAAVFLSLLVPGLGQLAAEQTTKGIVMMGGWLAGWGIAWLIPDGVRGLLSIFGLGGRASVPFQPFVLLPVGLAAAFHLWSIFDAASKAGHYRSTKVERPIPPVDKDFEI